MNRSSSLSRFFVPSVGACLWLAIFLVLTLSNWRLVLVNADGDPALHWGIGNWMIEHHTIITTDQFSHTRAGAPLITKEWLSEIICAVAGNRLGWNGFVLVAAFLIATTLYLLHRQLLAEGCEPVSAIGLTVLAAFSMSHHWLARPHLFTHLLALVFAIKLRAFDRNQISGTRLCAWLVPLMALWANLHGAFFTGFVLIGCYVPANLRERKKLVWLLVLVVAGLLTSLLNPNGWHLHAHIVSFIRSPVLTGYANEFRSPDFHSPAMHGFLLLLLALGLVLVIVRPRLSAVDITLLAVWGYFALHSVRNIPIFTLVAVPIVGQHLSQWLRDRRARLPATERLSAGLAAWQSHSAGWIVAAIVVGLVIRGMIAGHISTEVLADRFPIKAVQFLADHPSAVPDEMFNAYGWGGYLVLHPPLRRVFVDSRNDFYGPEFMEEFETVDHVKPGWEAVLDKYRVRKTILPMDHPLNALLALENDWREIHRDDVAVIYSRAQN